MMSLRFISIGFVFIFHSNGASVGDFCDLACGLVALVPARGGSKGLPNKNLAILGNKTLLSRTISTIKASNVFESIWVSTDVERIAREAEISGANVHWRAAKTATDNATTLSVVQDFIQNRAGVRTIAVVQCTSPFLCPAWLIESAALLKNQQVDCVFSVTRSFKLRWSISPDGEVHPENFNPQKRPRRQDWAGELHESGMFYFFRRHLAESGFLQNNRCKVVEVPMNRSIEIDSAVDLDTARALLPVLFC